MKLLVTGGLGFIGSNFIRQAIKERQFSGIINVDAEYSGSNPENLQGIVGSNKYTYIKGDIAKEGFVHESVKGVDAIINFAAETHVDRSIADPAPFIRSNVIGAYNLLEAARKQDVGTFVQVSTDEVYGDAGETRVFNETDQIVPSNPYSATKASAEHLALAYHRTYGLNCIVTRSSNNFGPYQFSEKLIPKTIIRGMKGMKIPLYGGGRQVRSWIYVLDNVEALELALKKGRPGQIYNVSAGNEISNRDLVIKVLWIMGKTKDAIETVEDRPGHDTRYSLDSSKARSELGWKPKHDFNKALRDTVEWYRKNRSWWTPKATAEILQKTPWRSAKKT
jgi:dTDP-glucose 4,6-dehydratase